MRETSKDDVVETCEDIGGEVSLPTAIDEVVAPGEEVGLCDDKTNSDVELL